jgi:hypothetical protein
MSATSGLLSSLFICAPLIQIQIIKRTFKLYEPFRDDVKIYGSGFYGCMAEQFADRVKIRSSVEAVGGKGVTQAVDTAGFGYAGFFLAL